MHAFITLDTVPNISSKYLFYFVNFWNHPEPVLNYQQSSNKYYVYDKILYILCFMDEKQRVSKIISGKADP